MAKSNYHMIEVAFFAHNFAIIAVSLVSILPWYKLLFYLLSFFSLEALLINTQHYSKNTMPACGLTVFVAIITSLSFENLSLPVLAASCNLILVGLQSYVLDEKSISKNILFVGFSSAILLASINITHLSFVHLEMLFFGALSAYMTHTISTTQTEKSKLVFSFFNEFPEAIIVMDLRSNVKYKNSSAISLLPCLNGNCDALKTQLSQFKIEGTSLYDDLQQFIEDSKTMHFPKLLWNKEYKCLEKSIEVTFHEVASPFDATECISLIIRNSSEKCKLKEMQMMEDMKSIMISTMSHELRTPLIGVVSSIEEVLLNNLAQSIFAKVSIAYSCSLILLNVVNCMLDFSQLELGSFKLHLSSFEIEMLVDEISHIFNQMAIEKGILIKICVYPNCPHIMFSDYDRIMQVLIHMLINSFTHTKKGEIILSLIPFNQTGIEFQVKDTGCGINSKRMAKLFKLFGCLAQDNEKCNCAGLGLTISHMIVSKMGSSIKVDSEESKGSAFSFCLPVQQPEDSHKNSSINVSYVSSIDLEGNRQRIRRLSGILKRRREKMNTNCEKKRGSLILNPLIIQSSTNLYIDTLNFNHVFLESPQIISEEREDTIPNESSTDISRFPFRYSFLVDNTKVVLDSKYKINNNYSILIVDDNPTNLYSLELLLSKYKVHIVKACDGVEAVKECLANQFSLIFMDIQMPIMDGIEASISILKNYLQNNKTVKIIALSAFSNENIIDNCKKVGISEFLTKPITAMRLKKVMKEYLNITTA